MFSHIDMETLEKELIQLRREFHRFPETGWTEFRTTVRIIEELQKLGLSVKYGKEIHTKENRTEVPAPEYLETCAILLQKNCYSQH